MSRLRVEGEHVTCAPRRTGCGLAPPRPTVPLPDARDRVIEHRYHEDATFRVVGRANVTRHRGTCRVDERPPVRRETPQCQSTGLICLASRVAEEENTVVGAGINEVVTGHERSRRPARPHLSVIEPRVVEWLVVLCTGFRANPADENDATR